MKTENECKSTSPRDIKAEEESDDSSPDVELTCTHCDNHPCVVRELEQLLNSILETYGGWKSNKEVRFIMYKDSVKFIFGTGLGKGVRKRLPACVQKHIHNLAPDDKYTGFIAVNDKN